MTRYEELDRKAYSCLAVNVKFEPDSKMGRIWMKHFLALLEKRNNLTIEEAQAPAVNPKMGCTALT